MGKTISAKSGFWSSPIKTIIYAWLIAGTLDIMSAIINSLIFYKGDLIGLFQYIASGLFGQSAFNGGVRMVFAGLVIHYLIALTWTLIFFFVYPKIKILSYNKIITGLIYGIFIWIIMNKIVLKFSGVPHIKFNLIHDVLGTAYLMFCTGLPVSIIISKYYSNKKLEKT